MDAFVNTQFMKTIEVQVQTKKQVQSANIYNDVRSQMNKLLQYFDFIPKRIEVKQTAQLNKKFFDLVVLQVLPVLEKRLNF